MATITSKIEPAKRKLKFLFTYGRQFLFSYGRITAVRKIVIEKEEYALFYWIVNDYFKEEMLYDEYKGILEAEGKTMPEDADELDTFGSLKEYFGRDFVVTDVEYEETEDDGTLVYRIQWGT